MAEGRRGADGNLAVALIIHYGLGIFWLFFLAEIVAEVGSGVAGVIWALCSVPLWIADSVRIVRAKNDFGAVWKQTFFWWLKTFVAPLFLVLEVISRPGTAPATERTPIPVPDRNPHPPSSEH